MKSGAPETDHVTVHVTAHVTVLLSSGGACGCVDGRSAGNDFQEQLQRVCSEKKRSLDEKREREMVLSVRSCKGRGARKTKAASRGPNEGRPTSCVGYHGLQRTASQ